MTWTFKRDPDGDLEAWVIIYPKQSRIAGLKRLIAVYLSKCMAVKKEGEQND